MTVTLRIGRRLVIVCVRSLTVHIMSVRIAVR